MGEELFLSKMIPSQPCVVLVFRRALQETWVFLPASLSLSLSLSPSLSSPSTSKYDVCFKAFGVVA